MNQRRALHAPGKRDDILRAHHVGPERAFQCGIESDVAGAVENNIDIVGNSLRLLLAVAEIRFSDIAAKHHDLVANEAVQSAAITLAKWIEWRRCDYAVPKTRL